MIDRSEEVINAFTDWIWNIGHRMEDYECACIVGIYSDDTVGVNEEEL